MKPPSAAALALARSWTSDAFPTVRHLAQAFEEFAAEAVQSERERCAKLCETEAIDIAGGPADSPFARTARTLAALIRRKP